MREFRNGQYIITNAVKDRNVDTFDHKRNVRGLRVEQNDDWRFVYVLLRMAANMNIDAFARADADTERTSIRLPDRVEAMRSRYLFDKAQRRDGGIGKLRNSRVPVMLRRCSVRTNNIKPRRTYRAAQSRRRVAAWWRRPSRVSVSRREKTTKPYAARLISTDILSVIYQRTATALWLTACQPMLIIRIIVLPQHVFVGAIGITNEQPHVVCRFETLPARTRRSCRRYSDRDADSQLMPCLSKLGMKTRQAADNYLQPVRWLGHRNQTKALVFDATAGLSVG